MLRHDPGLEPRPTAGVPATIVGNLPLTLTSFVGRGPSWT